MAKFATKRVGPKGPLGVMMVSLVVPLAIGIVPARAQGLFDFLRGFTQPVPAAPSPPPVELQPDTFAGQPRRGSARPKPAPVEVLEVKAPIQARHPGDMDNPFPALLADSTLRPGDMVMFPDGLRVFTGRAGSRHKVSDFTPVAHAGKALSRETRKLVSNLHPGENLAWSTDAVSARGKLADNAKEIDTTGSVKRSGSDKGARKR
ncbi:hypothetical protein [Microvirga sp. M2]|uniref:hypothetical protein n=1 Tax=Microvirga sp. M2 TaxID=3073270 RepID=UPI0039C27B2B